MRPGQDKATSIDKPADRTGPGSGYGSGNDIGGGKSGDTRGAEGKIDVNNDEDAHSPAL